MLVFSGEIKLKIELVLQPHSFQIFYSFQLFYSFQFFFISYFTFGFELIFNFLNYNQANGFSNIDNDVCFLVSPVTADALTSSIRSTTIDPDSNASFDSKV